MSAFDLVGVMDAIAAKVPAEATGRVYAWPVESVSPPCAVVGYPTEIDFDMTFQRGSDKAALPLWFMVGKVSDRTARDRLGAVITGATGIKTVLDGPLTLASGSTASLRVTDCAIEEVNVAGVAYLAARFTCEVIT